MSKHQKGRLIVGYWDCTHCNNVVVSGELRNCPNCGKARDENTKFYMNPRKIRYVPHEKAEKINRNPDWICFYCNQLNSDNDTSCISCGAPRTEKNETYRHFDHVDLESSDTTSNGSILSDNRTTYKPSTVHEIDLSYFSKRNRSNVLNLNFKPILCILLVIALICGCIWLFTPKYHDVSVIGFSWNRNIYIEKYQTVNESDWTLPVGARLKYTNTELSHYQQVIDHYETKTRTVSKQRISGYENYVSGYRDLGNGYFEEVISSRPVYETYYDTETYQEPVYRNEPIYLTKYYYEIDKWLHERTITTSASDHSPYWGEVILHSNERVSSKSEDYKITVCILKDEREETYSFSYDDWINLSIGDTLKIRVFFGSAEIVIED